MLTDLLISHPLPENMHIIPTTRDPRTNLALSSRNAYLTPTELEIAPIVAKALEAAQRRYTAHATARDSSGTLTGEDFIHLASDTVVAEKEGRAKELGVEVKLDYFEVFDKTTFEPVRGEIEPGKEMVIAGAVWVGKTRLIDNLLLGWSL